MKGMTVRWSDDLSAGFPPLSHSRGKYPPAGISCSSCFPGHASCINLCYNKKQMKDVTAAYGFPSLRTEVKMTASAACAAADRVQKGEYI